MSDDDDFVYLLVFITFQDDFDDDFDDFDDDEAKEIEKKINSPPKPPIQPKDSQIAFMKRNNIHSIFILCLYNR